MARKKSIIYAVNTYFSSDGGVTWDCCDKTRYYVNHNSIPQPHTPDPNRPNVKFKITIREYHLGNEYERP